MLGEAVFTASANLDKAQNFGSGPSSLSSPTQSGEDRRRLGCLIDRRGAGRTPTHHTGTLKCGTPKAVRKPLPTLSAPVARLRHGQKTFWQKAGRIADGKREEDGLAQVPTNGDRSQRTPTST